MKKAKKVLDMVSQTAKGNIKIESITFEDDSKMKSRRLQRKMRRIRYILGI